MRALIQYFLPIRAYAIAFSVRSSLLTTLGPPVDALAYCASSLPGAHPLDAHVSLAKHSYFSFRPRAHRSLRLARITLALLLRLSRNYATGCTMCARCLREDRERFNLTAADADDEAERDADARSEAASLRASAPIIGRSSFAVI